MSIATSTGVIPLVVDVDGTLVRTDLLWEGLVRVVLRRPGRLAALPFALLRGRAAFKAEVAEASALDTSLVPLEPATLALIEAARAEGRPIVLASAAQVSQLVILAERVGADRVFGSTAAENLKGEAKLARVREHYATFDYIGNDAADVPLWNEARQAIAVNAADSTLRRARRRRGDLQVVGERRRRLRAAIRLIRPHQWAKNTLLFMPAVAAHLPPTLPLMLTLLAGFAAFSALASAVYIVNDLIDLPNDRAHATKRARPLAAGDLSIPFGLGLAALLVLAAAAIASQLPLAFQVLLAGYVVLTTAYSVTLKRRAILDVIALATLYTLRVTAGAALVGVALSRWFLAFSVFFFFSLALAKRVIELTRYDGGESELVPGRGYRVDDAPVLTSLGTTAVMASALVYCLYITSAEIGQLYRQPDVLWIGLPILLYWQSRLWIFVGRKRLHEDPVVFALKDRMSRLLLLAFLVAVVIAS
jgi:4-hydroxybenzoate polyprenyltransferase/phosphoserine phosphatase